MSDEQQPGSEQPSETAQLERRTGDRWGDDISQTRQAELKALADKQREWAAQPAATRGESVFRGVRLTGADVHWLAQESRRHQTGHQPTVHLERAVLHEAHMERADLAYAHLELADLSKAHLEGATLRSAHLEGAWLEGAHLEKAVLAEAHLEGAILIGTILERARLNSAHLEGANLHYVHLQQANLTAASLDKTSHLNGAVLTGASLDQVAYDNVNLTVVDWSLVPVLGDELTAKTARGWYAEPKDTDTRREEYAAAVRANRVLAVTLRSQGMNEDADRYAYRAQLLQRVLLRRQRKWGRWLGTGLLDVISGYGYKPMRSVFTYVLVIVAFAALYFALGGAHGQALTWNESLVVSLTAFHGRGFFATAFQPGDPQAAVAAIEAVLGLLIEITFIATFTNRFFAR